MLVDMAAKMIDESMMQFERPQDSIERYKTCEK